MPELPEVETIRRQLLPYLPLTVTKMHLSKKVSSILRTDLFRPIGKTLVDIERKGKLLNFVFHDGHHLISGLGMSGSWRVGNAKILVKHTHIQLAGENRNGPLFLAYVDPRRFGKCHFVNEAGAAQLLDRLGVDISTPAFTAAYVKESCERYPLREIKPFLLDQKFFAGVGNYLACEILAHARISPTRLAGSLTSKERRRMVAVAELVLSASLAKRGLTFSHGYTDAEGNKGNALDNLVVFHQKICGLCEKETVQKITQSGRGTYLCPKCQK